MRLVIWTFDWKICERCLAVQWSLSTTLVLLLSADDESILHGSGVGSSEAQWNCWATLWKSQLRNKVISQTAGSGSFEEHMLSHPIHLRCPGSSVVGSVCWISPFKVRQVNVKMYNIANTTSSFDNLVGYCSIPPKVMILYVVFPPSTCDRDMIVVRWATLSIGVKFNLGSTRNEEAFWMSAEMSWIYSQVHLLVIQCLRKTVTRTNENRHRLDRSENVNVQIFDKKTVSNQIPIWK